MDHLGHVLETDLHGRCVGDLSLCLALAMRVSGEDAWSIWEAASLHDVGKTALPEGLIEHPGPLDADDFELVKTHTVLGARMLRGPRLELARQVAYYHHERWDGRGYHGVAGEAIPLAARICAVADVYDALVSDRPYRPSWDADRAAEEIERGAGTAFDPEIVEAFLTTVPAVRPRAYA